MGGGYLVNLLGTEEVKQVAATIGVIDEARMRGAYLAIGPGEHDTDTSEDDFGSTWDNFRELRQFFEKAAVHDRAVVLTEDQ